MRRIAVITTSRADYGIYRPLLRLLADDPEIELQLIVSGMHLHDAYGRTVDEIEADGFIVTEEVDMLGAGDGALDIAKAVGRGTTLFGEALAMLRPSVAVVLGDRFEMFAGAVAAQLLQVPLAHIHGGELTLGAMDDALRHAMTKLSHLHFVSTEEYGRRVRQMGEEGWRVIVSGAPGLDNLALIEPLHGAELERTVGIALAPAPLMVTYHPVTHDAREIDQQADALLTAIAASGLPVVFTAPNADEGGRRLRAMIRAYVAEHDNARYVENLGTRGYFGLMGAARAMVGNSSSGIIEAASFELPVVNIGSRQEGRIRAANVIDCEPEASAIAKAIAGAADTGFRRSLEGLRNPYAANGSASAIIHKRLKTVELGPELLKKTFQDLT